MRESRQMNEPAFPRQHTVADANDEAFKLGHPGMDLRDYFAAKAMQGILSADHHSHLKTYEEIVNASYAIADGMLKTRKENGV